MDELVLASGNRGKLAEFQQLFTGSGWTVRAQSEFATPTIEETGLSFVENAILKARNAAHHSGLPAIADDSGLEVDVLKGAPGIYSARYAGIDASDAANNIKLLQALQGLEPAQRSARFQCVLVYLRSAADPSPLICQGTWEGQILERESGDSGFGYDPLFYVPALQLSAAQLPAALKNKLSHRGQALAQMLLLLRQRAA